MRRSPCAPVATEATRRRHAWEVEPLRLWPACRSTLSAIQCMAVATRVAPRAGCLTPSFFAVLALVLAFFFFFAFGGIADCVA